jgi:hypothetical protein
LSAKQRNEVHNLKEFWRSNPELNAGILYPGWHKAATSDKRIREAFDHLRINYTYPPIETPPVAVPPPPPVAVPPPPPAKIIKIQAKAVKAAKAKAVKAAVKPKRVYFLKKDDKKMHYIELCLSAKQRNKVDNLKEFWRSNPELNAGISYPGWHKAATSDKRIREAFDHLRINYTYPPIETPPVAVPPPPPPAAAGRSLDRLSSIITVLVQLQDNE